MDHGLTGSINDWRCICQGLPGSDKPAHLAFSLPPWAWISTLRPLRRHQHQFVTSSVRFDWPGQGNACSNGCKGCGRTIIHTSAKKKHELKDEKLHQHSLVARDPVRVAELRQRFGSLKVGQTRVHQSFRKEVYS